MLKLFTEHVKGEDMYGLTIHAVMRITESVGRPFTPSPSERGAHGHSSEERPKHDLFSTLAAWSGELPQLPVQIWPSPTDGAPSDDKSHRLRSLRAQGLHTVQTVKSHDLTFLLRFAVELLFILFSHSNINLLHFKAPHSKQHQCVEGLPEHLHRRAQHAVQQAVCPLQVVPVPTLED